MKRQIESYAPPSKRQKEQDPSPLLSLPQELLAIIISFLGVRSLISFTLTCEDLRIEKQGELITELNLACAEMLTDKQLGVLTNIHSLNLCSNYVITDGGLSHLTNITNLNLDCNEMITDATLSLLTNITNLNLWSNNTITDTSLSLLTNITELNLRYNDAITVNGLTDLHNLTHLDTRGSNIEDEVAQLTGVSYM